MSIEPVVETTVASEMQVPSLSEHLAARRAQAVPGSRELLEPASLPKFAVTFRGYSRREVDEYVEGQRRHLASMRARAIDAERRLGEIDTPALSGPVGRPAVAGPRGAEPMLPPASPARGSGSRRLGLQAPARIAGAPGPLPRRLSESEFAIRRRRLGLYPPGGGPIPPAVPAAPSTALVVTTAERTSGGATPHVGDHVYLQGRILEHDGIPDVPEPLFYVPPLMSDAVEPTPLSDALDSALSAIARAMTVQSGGSVSRTGPSEPRPASSTAASPAASGDNVIALPGPGGWVTPSPTSASVGIGSVSHDDDVPSLPTAGADDAALPSTGPDFAAMAELLTAILAVAPDDSPDVQLPLPLVIEETDNIIDFRRAAARA